MSACAVGSSNGSNDSIDSIGYSEDELGQDYSPSPTKTGALIMAQRFIRQEFASNAEFEEEGTIVEETNVPGRFKVL